MTPLKGPYRGLFESDPPSTLTFLDFAGALKSAILRVAITMIYEHQRERMPIE